MQFPDRETGQARPELRQILVPSLVPRAALCLTLLFVGGCATESEAIFRSFGAAVFSDSSIEKTPLNPNYRYLRVTSNGGRLALLALGYVDSTPDGPVEVWYSGERETLRLQNGRVISASGMPTEWRGVVLSSVPAWSDIGERTAPRSWTRIRDVMPGYRMNVRDSLTLQPIHPPRDTELKDIDASRLRWFEERVDAGSGSALAWLGGGFLPKNALPPARYGVSFESGRVSVIYAEQCLDWDFCFAWQSWPATRATQ